MPLLLHLVSTLSLSSPVQILSVAINLKKSFLYCHLPVYFSAAAEGYIEKALAYFTIQIKEKNSFNILYFHFLNCFPKTSPLKIKTTKIPVTEKSMFVNIHAENIFLKKVERFRHSAVAISRSHLFSIILFFFTYPLQSYE